MVQFKFNKLSDADQLELLKYMPINERVRFERFNSMWAKLLARLWFVQDQLLLGTSSPIITRCHPIGRSDNFGAYNTPATVMLKIIRRCKNIKTLYVNSAKGFLEFNAATQLANFLNDCKDLEHLDILFINTAFFDLFVPTDKFTCLSTFEYANFTLLYCKKGIVEQFPLKCLNLHTFNFKRWNLIDRTAVEQLVTDEWDVRFNELINLRFVKVNF